MATLGVANRNQPPRGLPPTILNGLGDLQSSIPGFNNLSHSAAGNIDDLLKSLPSADTAKTATAFYGVGSGMPGSDFVRNRGYDLYRNQAEQRKQTGLNDFLSLIQGYSGTVAPSAGQNLQNQQFNANLAQQEQQFGAGQAQQQGQFDENMAFQNWLERQRLGQSAQGLALQGRNQNNNELATYLNFLN